MGPKVEPQTRKVEVSMLETVTTFRTPEQVLESMIEAYLVFVLGSNDCNTYDSSKTSESEGISREDTYKLSIQHRRDLSVTLDERMMDPLIPSKDKYNTLTQALIANFLSPFSITSVFPQRLNDERDPLPESIIRAFQALGSSDETSAEDISTMLHMNYKISQIHRFISGVLLPQYASEPDGVNINNKNVSKEQLEDILRRTFPPNVIEAALNFAIISGMLSRQRVLTDDERELYKYVRRRNASIMGWMQYLRYRARRPLTYIGGWITSSQQASGKSIVSTNQVLGIDTDQQILELVQGYDTLLTQQYAERQYTIPRGASF